MSGPPEPPAAPRWRSRLWLAIRLGVAGALIYAVVGNENFRSDRLLGALATPWFALTVLLGALAVSIGGLRWALLLRAEGIAIPTLTALRLTWIGHFWNMVIPGAVSGDLVKMAYVGQRAPERREEAWTTVVADRVIGLAALIALAVGAALARFEVVWAQPELRTTWLFMLALLGALVTCWILVGSGLAERMLPADSALARRLRLSGLLARAQGTLGRLARHPGACLGAFGLSLAVHLLTVTNSCLLGRALGEALLGPGDYAVVVPIAHFVNSVPISPGGLGVGEMMLGELFAWSGGLAVDGMAVMLLYRLAYYLLAGVGGLLDLAQRRGVDVPLPVEAPQPQV